MVNSFDDEILLSYIFKAIEYNNDLKIASYSTEEYYQAVKMQFANELPQAGLGFAPAYYKGVNTTGSDWAFALPGLVNYEADIFLKNRDKSKSAKKIYEGSLLDEKAVYISVVSDVAVTYLNIAKLDYLIELHRKIADDREQIYSLMLKRNKMGLTSAADTLLADKSYVQSLIDLSESQKQRDKLLHQLAVLTGESPVNIKELKRTPLDDIVFKGNIPSEISSEVITLRPDFLKAEKMLEKAGIDVKIAKKEFLPSINTTGLALFNANDIGSLLTTRNALMGLGGAGIWQIFSGGSKIAGLKYKKASYEKAMENYKKTNLICIQEINDALVTIKYNTDKYNKTAKQHSDEVKNYNYNMQKYTKGLISKLDLLQSEENLLNMKKIIQNEKAQLMVDYIGLYKAAGANI